VFEQRDVDLIEAHAGGGLELTAEDGHVPYVDGEPVEINGIEPTLHRLAQVDCSSDAERCDRRPRPTVKLRRRI
jgi:hypothetical protein